MRQYKITFHANLTDKDVRAMNKYFYESMGEYMEIHDLWGLELEDEGEAEPADSYDEDDEDEEEKREKAECGVTCSLCNFYEFCEDSRKEVL